LLMHGVTMTFICTKFRETALLPFVYSFRRFRCERGSCRFRSQCHVRNKFIFNTESSPSFRTIFRSTVFSLLLAGAAMAANQPPSHTHHWRGCGRCDNWVPGSPRPVFGRIHYARVFPWRDPHETSQNVHPSSHHLFTCLR